jgi:hypothetical protein
LGLSGLQSFFALKDRKANSDEEDSLMTKHEFLTELRSALEGQMTAQDIEENIRYYDSYFRESGKSEREVCEELGDPRLIARSLIDSFVASKGPMADYYTKQARNEYSEDHRNSDDDSAGSGEGRGAKELVDKIFRYIMIISVVIIVGALLIGVLRFVLRVVIPVVAVLLLFHLVVDWAERH